MVYGMRQLFKAGQLQLLPAMCVVCGNLHADPSIDLCHPCRALLPRNRLACRHCALPLAGNTEHLVCGQCLQRPPRYSRAYCAFEYAYPLAHLIRRCKYGHEVSLTRVLGHWFAAYLRSQQRDAWPRCFIPVPLHARRFQQRGYNQVIELGRWLEADLAIPMRTDLLERRLDTPEQAGLSRRARRRNLRRAFSVTRVELPKHVAVLDDVITTGTTVAEVTRTLLQAGVERVEVWGLARRGRAKS